MYVLWKNNEVLYIRMYLYTVRLTKLGSLERFRNDTQREKKIH